jgi:uncharacterized damage-inducible protein DinB
MDADAFRHFYEYHFAENRNIWDSYVTRLTHEQFTSLTDYSHGSVRDQIVHIISVDDTWFSGLRGEEIPEPLRSADLSRRASIREHWDSVEHCMRLYLGGLQAEMLSPRPLHGEDRDLTVWQVLLHVVNHGTDHRAQLLRMLNDMGFETTSQDYVFFIYDELTGQEDSG